MPKVYVHLEEDIKRTTIIKYGENTTDEKILDLKHRFQAAIQKHVGSVNICDIQFFNKSKQELLDTMFIQSELQDKDDIFASISKKEIGNQDLSHEDEKIQIFSLIHDVGELFVDKENIHEEDQGEIEAFRRDLFIAMKFKSYQEGLHILTTAIENHPFYFEFYLSRAELYIILKEYAKSLKDINVYFLEGSSFKAYLLKFYSLYKLGNMKMASYCLLKAYTLAKKEEDKTTIKQWQHHFDVQFQNDLWEEMKHLDSETHRGLQKSVYDIGMKFLAEYRYDLASSSFLKIINYIDSNDLDALIEYAKILKEAKKYHKAILYFLQAHLIQHNYRLALEEIGDCYMELKNYALSLHIFRSMIQEDIEEETDQNTNLKVKFALALHYLGGVSEALDIFINVLSRDEDHYGALLGYSIAHLDSMDYLEASKSLLRLLVNHPLSKKIKRLFALCLKDKAAFEFVTSQIRISSSFHKIGHFLGHTLKKNGLLKEAEQVYRIVIKESPLLNYYLGLSNILEVQGRVYDALDVLKMFIRDHPETQLNGISMTSIYNKIRCVAPKGSFKSEADIDAIYPEIQPKAKNMKTKEGLTSSDEYLVIVNIAIMRLLFTTGALHILLSIVELLKPLTEEKDYIMSMLRCNRDFYVLLTSLIPLKNPKLKIIKPNIHIIGDNNSLSPSWEMIQYQKEQHLMVPHFIEGLKLYHLRHDKDSHYKTQLGSHLSTIAPNSTVIFVIGELDCKEGFFIAIQNYMHNTYESAMLQCIKFYIDFLLRIKQRYGHTIYVHPVTPGNDTYRPTILMFNRLLKEKLNEHPDLHFLDIMPQLTLSDGRLKKEYELDGVYMNPSYIKILEKLLNQ